MHKDWLEVDLRDVVSHIHWVLPACNLTQPQVALLDKGEWVGLCLEIVAR